ncbi:MAG: leucine-rich repeat domain-containing protein [Bacteroidales bacterium]|nr:leucine-rich repeat domain-containing protein [Bacteroidales bacterium]
MKKILLFALPLLAMIAVSCEKDSKELSGDDIIEFKDPNFLKVLLNVQEIEIYDEETDDWVLYMMDVDANKDGKISVNEAQKVKGLILIDYETGESFNIKEMPEIKYFTALTHLYCGGNQLTTLDVSGCTALTHLYCDDNQLTTLDLSKNIALTGLYCDGNQLTTLDVSGCTALTHLYCDDNQLTTLDLSKNIALTGLYCSDNQLTKVILSANHSLNNYTIQHIINEYGNIIEYR